MDTMVKLILGSIGFWTYVYMSFKKDKVLKTIDSDMFWVLAIYLLFIAKI